jgi:hypothetical protein
MYKPYRPSQQPANVKIKASKFKTDYDYTRVKARPKAELREFTYQEFMAATDTCELTLVKKKRKKKRNLNQYNDSQTRFNPGRPYTPEIPSPGRGPY